MKKRTINVLYGTALAGLLAILFLSSGCEFFDGLVGDEEDGSEEATSVIVDTQKSTNTTVNVNINHPVPVATPAPTVTP